METTKAKKWTARRVLGDILIVLAAAFVVYLWLVMRRRIETVVLAAIYKKVLRNEELLCLGLLLAALDLRFGWLTKLPNRPLKALGWVVRAVLIAGTVFLLGLVGRVVFTGLGAGNESADHVIVLGMALENGQPTKDLLGRVETARRYGVEHPESVLILTGGNPDPQGRTEAAVMRDLLLSEGFPAERMILEDKASNTMQNFANTAELIDPQEPVMLVSSNYHMQRAMTTARSAGFTHVIRLPAPSEARTYGANVMWEVMMEINGMTARRRV